MKLTEDIDYYCEDGLIIFTEQFLLKRGKCCNNGCRHCPYESSAKEEDGKTDNIQLY